ncbi:hypothetical protein MIMGU_mgv11b023423mg [Erythranthe guttata]|uniref:Uncharacterized protein n=1 Tax=Erythranthe guttata TaxID=4155 RepID=A0A022RQB3_ERYGU|nr:hypothetical protein MIMGU_mgv11b023423mg [Erythranthe guttata]
MKKDLNGGAEMSNQKHSTTKSKQVYPIIEPCFDYYSYATIVSITKLRNLTVGLLESGTCTTTSKLLRLAPPRVRHQQSPVVPDQNILDLLLRLLVDVFLVEDLGGVTAALDADAHVDSGEALAAEEEDWLERLVAEDLRLDQLDWDSVHLDQSAAALAKNLVREM